VKKIELINLIYEILPISALSHGTLVYRSLFTSHLLTRRLGIPVAAARDWNMEIPLISFHRSLKVLEFTKPNCAKSRKTLATQHL